MSSTRFFRHLSYTLGAILIAVLVACGGGGGGGPTGVVYSTLWPASAPPGSLNGFAQVVTIIDSTGLPRTSQILRTPSAGTESVTFDLPAGTYAIKAELYPTSAVSGSPVGVMEQRLVISKGRKTMTTRVAATITGIVVDPESSSVQIGRGEQFRCHGVDSTGTATFIAPGSTNWSVLGGVGNVSNDGNFSGTVTGSGFVRATYTPLALNGSAPVSVVPGGSTTRSKWTVLVYMNAANDLNAFSTPNVNQMEKVAGNPDVRFVVQWKQAASLPYGATFDGTRRYLVRPDTSSAIASTLVQNMGDGIDMGSPQTLREFIAWGKANYPADRYSLIVWNHGAGWRRSAKALGRAVSFDDELGTSIQTWELGQALSTEQFDILAWDSSLMQMMEVAYEVRNNVRYVVGSEESPPGEGYPYDLVFDNFRDNPNASTSSLTKAFVDGMLEVPAYNSRKITQSSIDTTRLPALATALSTLADQLRTNQVALASVIQNARANAQGYSPTSSRVFRDISSLCDQIDAGTTIPGVLTATAGVRTALTNAVIWEGHNANSAGSRGLAIDFSSGTTLSSTLADYQRLQFAADTTWDEFLQAAP